MQQFWAQLQPRYQYFETHKQLKTFKVTGNGNMFIDNLKIW
jgi:murein L,D-transpeptidase YafK